MSERSRDRSRRQGEEAREGIGTRAWRPPERDEKTSLRARAARRAGLRFYTETVARSPDLLVALIGPWLPPGAAPSARACHPPWWRPRGPGAARPARRRSGRGPRW